MKRSLTDQQVRELHRQYLNGVPSTTLASSTGLANLTIRRNFLRLGLSVRSHSEARKNMWKSVTPKQKTKYLKAAHEKMRGRPRSFDELCKRAITREKWPTAFSDQEKYLVKSLKLSGLSYSLQKACGPFNIDFALDGKIAIEVFGGRWHGTGRHAKRFKRRSEYLLKEGWRIIIIWLVKRHYRKNWSASLDTMHSLIREAQQDPTPSIRTILANGKHK